MHKIIEERRDDGKTCFKVVDVKTWHCYGTYLDFDEAVALAERLDLKAADVAGT